MTNPPYATGPEPQPQNAPGAPSFQYRPHDPYGTFAAGQPTGPVLPPAPTFWQRWGILPLEGRPKQVTWMLQLLWVYFAAAVLLTVVSLAFSALLASFLDSAAGIVLTLVFSVIVLAAVIVLIWAIARERLGRFGFQDPRAVFYIGLGLLGLNAVCGFIGVVKVPFAIVQLLAVLCVLGLVFSKPVAAWLRLPGNQSAKDQEPQAGPDDHVFPGYQPPPPQWRDAAPQPGLAPPPAAGGYQPPAQPGPPAANPGWPQPPQ
ncbi:hypothetical protein [Glycomyces niveus]|jgi:hypothetical protein|uniref:DUF805 domain-containing protein n=1 Tax=Glycomyces niveus TaxID=2820287 RepID=A0ABS3U0Z2_9ACTN|nr:hypothetical protein [Glycomyces sp. NEAU-S30]MBO3732428.1 hypothetical protein [Glycomyces sp. NEAU-S30]